MSKKNKSQTNTSETDDILTDDGIEITDGITPEEGVDSINETITDIPEEEVVEVSEVVSVADTKESTSIEEEDSSATVYEEPVEEKVEETPIVEKTVIEGAYYVSLGFAVESKMPVIKERLMKAGYSTVKLTEIGELLVGPFETETECITARKAIVSRGLRGRIVNL